ncbi:hypothetical protein OTU49_005631 [Cherax quadricarinatus]|uniref:Mitochondrial assembly of ribosomal large subunit protein 1 n=1 Tax=Cherax quadricarinatus TaxID=27406 RepID=A0AAW0YAN1_CHEQU
MYRVLSSRTCELCTKASLLFAVRCKPRNIHQYPQILYGSFPVQSDLPVQLSGVSSHRSLNTHCWLRDRDKTVNVDFSQDPKVQEWLKEVQSDIAKEGTQSEFNKYRDHDIKSETCIYKGTLSNDSDLEEMESESTIKTVGASGETGEHLEAKQSTNKWTQHIYQKYKKFDGSSFEIIYDYDEERLRREEGLFKEEIKEKETALERGKTGVFDVEELVDFLREENAKDIAVIHVPPDIKYVQYLVIVSSHSKRHTSALAQLLRKVYKRKKHPQDPPVIVEGKGSDWIAMDMGNIALHIMKPQQREIYNLETLWTVGPQYDEQCQEKEESLMDMSDPLAGFTASTLPSENKSV